MAFIRVPPPNCAHTKRLISARSSPAKPWASKKCTTIFGWSVLWIMIWDTSIWRPEGWNPSRTHSAQKFKIYYQGTLLHHCRKISQYGARRAVLLRRNDLQDQGKSVQSGTPAKGGVPHRRPSLLRAVRSWVLPMSPVQSVTHVSGSDRIKVVGASEFEPPTSWSRTSKMNVIIN